VHADEIGDTFTDEMIERIVRAPRAAPTAARTAGPSTRVRAGGERGLLAARRARAGPAGEIVRLAEHDGDLLHWFYDEGYVPGSNVEMREAQPAAGQLKVVLADERARDRREGRTGPLRPGRRLATGVRGVLQPRPLPSAYLHLRNPHGAPTRGDSLAGTSPPEENSAMTRIARSRRIARRRRALAVGAAAAGAADRPPLADDVAARLGVIPPRSSRRVQGPRSRPGSTPQSPAGRLTPEQGARLKTRIANAKGLGLGIRKGFPRRHHAFVRTGRRARQGDRCRSHLPRAQPRGAAGGARQGPVARAARDGEAETGTASSRRWSLRRRPPLRRRSQAAGSRSSVQSDPRGD
jgi:hypothetical protein